MDKSKKIAIIGSGIGGLSAAIRLANAGYSVDVYEQNSSPGGKANQIEGIGFRFDSGPSLITMPFVINNLFNDVGEQIDNYLEITPLEILCKYFYSDGTIINAYSDINKFAEEISNKTNDSAEAILKYLEYSKNIYELTANLFLFNDFTNNKNLFNFEAIKTLLQIWKIDPFRTMHNANKSFFNDYRTIQLFDRYATYNGSNPYKAPATLNIIQHVEYNLGGFVVKGGVYALVKALYKLAIKKGVNFYFGSRISQILQIDNRIIGLMVAQNGKIEKYDYKKIVSNADSNYTYKNLLKDTTSKPSIRYSALEPSSSAIVLYWGVKGNFNQLITHNILFSENYKEEFVDLFDRKTVPKDPTIYIYISSKNNITDAPLGYENWFVMINAPYSTNQNWEAETDKARQKIISKIKNYLGIDLSDKIVFEEKLTPDKIEKLTSSFRGSLYGISSNSKRAAFVRQRNRSEEYSGLYFCGGSAHPGGGIPLVMLSGKIASELIIEDDKR